MDKPKALVAMSGGVDSSVAAWLTDRQGYDCIGATMRLFDRERFCPGSCASDDAEDARAVAERLNMPFHLFDCSEEFEDKVIRNFIATYECGRTPNPCIQCNRCLKFDLFLKRALAMGCEKIVTGHYAQIRRDAESGRYLLCKAADLSKDQSYVLYTLTQHQLAHTLFPLGELTKEQARAIAEEQGFVNARKHDSQDICFIPDGDYMAFMERYTGKTYEPGDFLDLSGKVVGRHKGAVAYTLGQRKGLGLAMGAPVYVCGKDMTANTVTVGCNESLFATELLADNVNWIAFSQFIQPTVVKARTRYNQKEQTAIVYPRGNGTVRVKFDAPQRAMTPGQAVVFYHGDIVLGGGTITEILK